MRKESMVNNHRSIMVNLKFTKKILSIMLCAAVSCGAVAASPNFKEKNIGSADRTIQEIQEQRKANSEKIAELENQISSLANDQANERAYQDTLREQISIIQDNIDLLNQELESIDEDINTTEQNITQLDSDIEQQQDDIDKNIEVFKERLCYMYVNGNDNLASVVLGSSSFYDMMSRVQMANRIAEYDEDLINNILGEIDELEASKKDLESERLNLQMKQEDQKKRKEEKAAERETLNVKMQDTEDEIARIAKEQEMLNGDKAELEAANAQLAAEEADIQEQIRRAAEEAQRRFEEEQRRNAAETAAAAQAAAEAAAAQAAAQAAANASGSEDTYVAPAPVYQEPVQIQSTVGSSGFVWPAPGFSYISSGFGYRWGRSHNGIDIGDAGIMGGAAVAAQSGTVITANNSCSHNYAKTSSCGCGGGYGNYVVISHDGTYSTLYGHLQSVSVNVGDYVSQGQVIGYIGSTGWSTGAHLHFEIRMNGVPQDPSGYVWP